MHSSSQRSPLFASQAALRPLPGLCAKILRAGKAVRALPREELSPAGVWLEDHARFLAEEAEALRLALRSCPRLPAQGRTPRVLLLARFICVQGEGEVTAPLILRAAREYLGDEEITERELCFLPAALRLALFEALLPVLSACRMERALRRDALRRIARLKKGEAAPPQNSMLLEKMLSLLSSAENAEGLQALDALCAKAGMDSRTAAREAHEALTRQGQTAGKLILSLRETTHLPFDRLLERLRPVAAVLRQEDTYRRMDRESRENYRRRTEWIARRLHVQETAVARAALALAAEETGVRGQAGYYLLEAENEIARYLLKRPQGLWGRHRAGCFVAVLAAGAALFLTLCIALGAPGYAWLPLLLCGSEIARLVYFRFLRRRYPPRMLPRIALHSLSPAQRTLIVVPTLLASRKQALHMARQLSLLRSASPEERLDFMLLGDFADSPQAERPEDAEILAAAAAGVEALNEKTGGGFYYLHRARAWDAGQQCFTGRERKRGALEALNRLLVGEECPDAFVYASCRLSDLAGRYAYVLTLDADTFLPPGEALRLIGAMEHPLQKGRVGVIQPRMEVAADGVRTRTQALLGGRGGVDPYHLSVQDIYQDVFGRGSFVGKGIYAPAQWLRALEGRVPAGRLLSHDLIEGEIVGGALAEDIVLYDGHPARLPAWQKRLHRWTRGDWQLLPFLKDRRLSLLSRHKIWDNLRRSLVPAAQLLLLMLGAGLGTPLLCLAALPWPLRGMGTRLLLLPAKALTLLDALCRALYRQFVSRRQLLSWVTAAQAEAGGAYPLSCVLFQLFSGALLILLSLLPGGFLPLVFLGMGWTISPLLARYLDRPLRGEPGFTPAQRQAVRDLARDTWRFFEEAVTKEQHFLPPDNVQLDPDKGAACRTSPTNIGLYLLSCAAARTLGLITTAEMARRMQDTTAALEQLESWHGHLYNWYATDTLAPLPPLFVSTVDSGNLAGCLTACAQLCRERLPEMESEYRALPARLDALSQRMDFAPLYDKEKKLFYIGWDVAGKRPTPAHYDLLASEARLASFVAIARHQVPREHWARMNRSVTRAGGGPALLSWGGTCFEYLMPALLLPLTPGTLLGESCMNAVRAQISAAGRRPFGVSESGYYAFDPELNYQYRAFGLPALALSADTGGQVVAPYASMLALPFFPRAAALNLQWMRRLGWTDRQGLYEAADYSPQRVEKTPRLVMSHMAHHQGMILCAACNALTDFSLVRAFMALPAARAYAYLLCERAPARPPRRRPLPPARQDAPQTGALFHPAHEGLPLDAHALSGHGTTWLLNAQGQGYLACNGVMISRFFPEAGMQTGPQFYLRDMKTGEFFRPAADGTAFFDAGSAVFSCRRAGLQITLRCCVEPLSGTAQALLQLENPGKQTRELEAVSFLELAQGARQDDEAHPNFRDLSIQVSPLGGAGLLSRRLPRDGRDRAPLIAHFVGGDVCSLRRQGDRVLFLGRTGDYAAPEQMRRAPGECDFRTGDVIAPCLSLRAGVRVPAGGKAALCFFTAAGESEAALSALPCGLDAAREALSLSAARARMTLRFLHIDGAMLALYQQMLGAICFFGQPHQALLPPAPQNALWRAGLSGALPLLLVRLGEDADKPLIRHALRAHAWMRAQGVWVELVFACGDAPGYLRPAQDAVSALIAAGPSRDLLGVPGGVRFYNGTEEEIAEMESLARLTLRGGAPLARQLAALRRLPAPAAGTLCRPTPVLPPPLTDFNGYGGFTPENAYCVTAPAPAPWHNILAGRRFGTVVCEGGILQSFGENSRLERITRAAPDVHRAALSEEIFLRTEEGSLYPLARCTALHEPGATVYSTLCGAVYADLTVFCHPEAPQGVRYLLLRSEAPAKLRLFYLARFSLGERPEAARCQAEGNGALARAGDTPFLAYACMEGGSARALAPAQCFGLRGEAAPPGLWARQGAGGSVAVMERDVALRPHEPLAVVMLLGRAADAQEAKRQAEETLRAGAGGLLRAVRGQWAARLSGITLYSESATLDRMLNRWLPYQAWAARLMARTGPYQTGGAFGFRDQLQDLLCLLHTDPAFARAHLLLCAAHQFPEGDVQHWWHAPRRGVRTRISDDKLFLPYLTALYVKITGDESILQENAPYLESAPLSQKEEDRYEEPSLTPFQEPLLSHCLRALDSVALGKHDLPLMGGGDWNDGMNRVGGLHGESVWLGFFLALTIQELLPYCPQPERPRLSTLRRQVLSGAENAWTGKWYLRAWYDSGEPLGGPDTHPPRIDLISQAFSALAGAPRAHAREAVAQAAARLYDREAGIVRLLDPPFTPEENAGYIGAYLPGVRENGGQYTHAAPWLILALRALGENALAWEIARALLPVNHGNTGEKIARYRLEPYVLAGDVYAGENRGRGGWSWYTGSAAWLYFVFLTALLGFEKRGDKARLAPCPEPGGAEYTLVYRFGSASYQFTAARDVVFPTLDGEKLPDGWAPLVDDGKTHEARYPLKI